MIQSRCGLLCDECKYRDGVGCAGCIHIAKPFWGDACPVKSCCEGRSLPHCGECAEFPCQVLAGFAYDENQGDGGRRLDQCRRWRDESTGR